MKRIEDAILSQRVCINLNNSMRYTIGKEEMMENHWLIISEVHVIKKMTAPQ